MGDLKKSRMTNADEVEDKVNHEEKRSDDQVIDLLRECMVKVYKARLQNEKADGKGTE